MNAFGSYQIDLRRSFKKRILGPFDKWPVSNQGSYVFLSLGCNRNRRLHRSEQARKRDLGNTDHAETRRTAPSRALQTCRLKRSLEKCTVYDGFWHFSCRPTSPRRFFVFCPSVMPSSGTPSSSPSRTGSAKRPSSPTQPRTQCSRRRSAQPPRFFRSCTVPYMIAKFRRRTYPTP